MLDHRLPVAGVDEPAHYVITRRLRRGRVHCRDARRCRDRHALEAPVVGLGRQVARHIGGGRDHPAAAAQEAVQLTCHHRLTEDDQVALGQPRRALHRLGCG
jgi:hypothetical protein